MSIRFNGNNYFQCSAAGFPLTEAAKTVCFNCNIGNATGVHGFINATDPTLGIGYQIGIRNANQLIVWGYGGGTYVTTALPALSTWVQIAYVYTGTTHRIYLDGVLAASSTTAVQTGQPTVCQIGGNQWSESLLNTMLEDIRVYNRVLTVNELQTIRLAGQADLIVSGLLAWWPCVDRVNGSTLTAADMLDYSAYKRAATLSGVAPFPVSIDSVSLARRLPNTL